MAEDNLPRPNRSLISLTENERAKRAVISAFLLFHLVALFRRRFHLNSFWSPPSMPEGS
jgi:hypothetical protein